MNARQLLAVATLAALTVSAAPAPANAQSATVETASVETAHGESAAAAKNPWRGSSISYSNSSTAISARKDAEPTWNPVYVHSLTLAPEWHFGDDLLARLNFEFQQELTNSDYTAKKNEYEWSNLTLEVATPGWVEPTTEIRVSGGIRFGIPFSKISAAQSLKASVSPGLNLSRKFDVLQGLTVGLSGRFSHRFFGDTTSSYDGHGIVGCKSADCDSLRNTGDRSSPWDLSGGPSVTLSPVEKLNLTTSLGYGVQHVFTLEDASIPADGRAAIAPASPDDPNSRYLSIFVLDATYALVDQVSLSVGANTGGQQLAPNGLRRSPFFNRNTVVYFGIGLDVDTLITKL